MLGSQSVRTSEKRITSSKIANKRKTARRERVSRACKHLFKYLNPTTTPLTFWKAIIVSECQMSIRKKNAPYLSVNVFSTKVLIGDTIFTSPTGLLDGTAISRGHPSHAQGSRHLQCKAVPSFLSYFKTLSISPAPGIEPATDPALQSSALPPELILRVVSHAWDVC